MKGRLLYIAYHYPPITVSSGVHRTLAFTRYLADWGWDISVLTADYKAYPRYDLNQLDSIPSNINVIRAWAKDTARDLSIKQRYSRLMALPDRYQSWILGGVLSGLNSIRKNRPDVIISTYPIASAHYIAYFLHRITGIPWVADFRDPMAQEGYPTDPLVHRSFRWIEEKAVKHASKLIFVTDGALRYYQERYGNLSTDKYQLIQNGYDEEVFKGISQDDLLCRANLSKAKANVINVIHSGVIYPSERDPTQLFKAIREIKDSGFFQQYPVKITLRATGHDDFIAQLIKQNGIDDLIALEPPIPYSDALTEMMTSDILLLLQADNCNDQIPAKAYEYIRIGKPILSLACPQGETGKLMGQFDNCFVAALENKEDIIAAFRNLLESYTNLSPLPREQFEQYSREQSARKLETLLSSIIR